jgi:hypothetical protein
VRTFAARYPGRCPAGDPIEPGDEVTYVDEQLAHAVCAENEQRAERAEPSVCPSCWTVHRGECL